MFIFSYQKKGEVQDKNATRMAMARPHAAGELDAVALETALLEAWKSENAFQQSIESNRNGAPFIFPVSYTHLTLPTILLV